MKSVGVLIAMQSQMAEGYFNAGAPNGDIKNFDPDVTCQLNYVIVISDGK